MTKRILIIDDDIELCEELSEILQGQGYLVDLAYDGGNGERLIEQNRYDMVILDYKLPGENGFEILKRIKEKRADLAVFLVSGKPQLGKYLAEEKLADQVAGVINKPFAAEVLLDKLKLFKP